MEELRRDPFTVTYLGFDVGTPNRSLSIKILRKNEENLNFYQLHIEARLYRALNNKRGFPQVYHFGNETDYEFLVMEHLGPNIAELLAANGGTFSMKCVCIIASQMITRLEALHQHDFIHRHIEPDAFLVGRNEKASELYLCDLGFSKQYRDGTTKSHTPCQKTNILLGEARYAKLFNSNKIIFKID